MIYVASSFVCIIVFVYAVALFTKVSKNSFEKERFFRKEKLYGKVSNVMEDWIFQSPIIQALTQFIGHDNVQPVEKS